MTNGNGAIKVRRWHQAAVVRNATVIGIVGLVLWTIGVVVQPRQAFASYLFAYVAALTIVLGALIQVMISHVTGAHWFTVLRRLTLLVTGSLPALAVMVLPLIIGVRLLYPWAAPAHLTVEAQKLVVHRHAWLNVPFFAIRAVIYVVLFAECGEMLRRWATIEDSAANEMAVVATVRRQRRLSAIGLVIVGLALTLVAFDWLMPLDTLWYSTVYGVYVFAGGFIAALGLMAGLAYVSASSGALAGIVGPDHFGALGKLMLTFVIFWAYIAFSQFLIIWIGDIPADSSWYVTRASGSWGTLGLIVAIGQFAVPFTLLLSRSLKRRPAALGAIGAWLVIMHFLDVYWLVLPAFHPAGVHVSWLDVAAPLMVGGFATAFGAWRARDHLALPVSDPYISQAVHYAEP